MPRTTKNYRQKRDEAYREELPVGEQLDAVLKAFDMVLSESGFDRNPEQSNKYPGRGRFFLLCGINLFFCPSLLFI